MKEQLLILRDNEIPDEFDIKKSTLFYKDLDLLKLAKEYGTPLRYTYLPSISNKIEKMKKYFQRAIETTGYQGKYEYYYCTKSSHFQHIVKQAIQSDIGIEISSAYDVELIKSLITAKKLKHRTRIICNGYKTQEYREGIVSLIEDGYCSVLPMTDSKDELIFYSNEVDKQIEIKIGVRLNLSFISSYTKESRFGISPDDIITVYENATRNDKRVKITTLHFFNEQGINGNNDFWAVLEEVVKFYCKFRRLNKNLTTLDIGGGMPFRNSIAANFDIEFWVCRIVSVIQSICSQEGIEEPNIITEFGKYTVAEATCTIFKVLEKKQGNDVNWAVIDGSFITHLPDTWAINQEYPVLPVNNIYEDSEPFILGGLTCDSDDHYPHSDASNQIMLPVSNKEQFIVFLHTGAYQEALSGFGGVNHCLIPAPKHVIIDRDDNQNLRYSVFSEKQHSDSLLKILGYSQ